MAGLRHELATPDGRTLAALEVGAPDGPLVFSLHGTPGSGLLYRTEVESAERLGLRLVAYDRPGYGGSTPQPGRRVADAAGDVAAIAAALGGERFAVYGWSGGGPHALACAALLGGCAAVATVAGVAEIGATGLDWFAGMGEGNQVEFGTAKEGREPLAGLLREEAAGLMAASPEQLAEAMRPHLSDVDAAALTGELADHLAGTIQRGLRPGIDGWLDDDLAFVQPWGFDLAAVTSPAMIWQGEHDLMVPPAHGRWLHSRLDGAGGGIEPGEGHLTLFVNRIGDVHAWLAERLVEGAG